MTGSELEASAGDHVDSRQESDASLPLERRYGGEHERFSRDGRSHSVGPDGHARLGADAVKNPSRGAHREPPRPVLSRVVTERVTNQPAKHSLIRARF